MERTALAFSDGSFTVHAEGWPLDRIIAERDEVDAGLSNPDELTRIIKVRLEIIDDCVVPLHRGKATMVRCRCGRQYKTRGGVEECLAVNHRQST